MTLVQRQAATIDAFDKSRFQVMCQMAEVFIRSRMLPPSIQTPEQAIVIMLKGQELGLQPLQAVNGINVIQGKPTVSPQLMLALIHASGQLEDMQVTPEGESMKVTMKRKGKTPHTERFGKKEAQDLGLIGKDNYKKQPMTMYKWRAVAACARTVFPDVIDGLYTPEEMGADVVVDEEGSMTIQTNPQPAQSAQQANVEVVEEGHFTPAEEEKPVEDPATDAQIKKLNAMLSNEYGFKTRPREDVHSFVGAILKLDLHSLKDLTKMQASALIEKLQEGIDKGPDTCFKWVSHWETNFKKAS